MTTEPESPVRDAALEAAWRAHSLEEPPAHLDAAIRAAAHGAVAAEPREVRTVAVKARGPQRWWMPLAAAAMISAVVIGVSRLVPQDRAELAPGLAAPPIPSPPPAPPVAFAPSPAERGPTTALGGVAPSEAAASDSARAGPPSESSESGVTFAPQPPSLPQAGASAAHTEKFAASPNARAARTPDAEAWIDRIRKLYDEGKRTEAAEELEALRAAVPDADRRLPPELRAWATTVEP